MDILPLTTAGIIWFPVAIERSQLVTKIHGTPFERKYLAGNGHFTHGIAGFARPLATFWLFVLPAGPRLPMLSLPHDEFARLNPRLKTPPRVR